MNSDALPESIGRFIVWLFGLPFTIPLRFLKWLWKVCEPKPAPVDWEKERRIQDSRKRQQMLNQAKCEELRLECELLYSRYAKQLRDVLPLERFKTLLEAYLTKLSDLELTKKRSAMIQKMIMDYVSATESTGKAKFESLQELAEHFSVLRIESQELPYDEGTRDSILTALNKQEDEAIECFFKQ